jgi:predicted phosphodiesterase
MDAGDLLEVLVHAGVHVVLSGHKHVPYVWRIEDLYIANAGTVSSLRLRGYGKPCYNVLEFDGDEVSIYRVFPFEGERHLMARFVLFEAARHHREAPVQQVAATPEAAQ